MKTLFALSLVLTIVITSGFDSKITKCTTSDIPRRTFHDFQIKTINGEEFDLNQLKGKKVIVVNVASKCGLTPQYEILQKLYDKMDKSKFEIIGFPANNFLKQEPGTNEEIEEFCKKNYGVTFPIMEKVSVCDYIYKSFPPKAKFAEKTETHEIYQWLTQKKLNGVTDTKMKWNFQKFLIDEEGNLIGSLDPKISEELRLITNWLE